MRRWLDSGLDAVEPSQLTRAALEGPPATVVAIGKAAPRMCHGAAEALGSINGICVTYEPVAPPPGVEMMIGDHPIPGSNSLRAGERVLDMVGQARGRIVALISGGGSALCEMPREGVDLDFIKHANHALLHGGATIEETNLVRGHLSAIKCGGLARATERPIETLVLSDVAGSGPEVVASGPTLPMRFDPMRARRILHDCGIEVPERIWEVIQVSPGPPGHSTVEVIGDGKTAAEGTARAAHADGYPAVVSSGWMGGALAETLADFIETSGRGVTVAAGEVTVDVSADGAGGRNTHAALLAAQMIEGTEAVFAAFATDGVDGRSNSAGAIVDGMTTARGGAPQDALRRFDSASYLATAGDLIPVQPTGTNVADQWVLYRP